MTRVLVDTNVVISALLFPASVPAQALALVIDEHTSLRHFKQEIMLGEAYYRSGGQG